MNIGNRINRLEKVVADSRMAPKLLMFLILQYILLHFDIYAAQFDKGFQLLYRLVIDHPLGLDISCILVTPCGVR